MSVKILSVEATPVDDQLLVTGKVGKQDVQVTVWKSHLYGDKIQPNAKHKLRGDKTAYERAPDHEQNPGPRDPEVPQTDAERKAYLRAQLEAAVPKSDSNLDRLTD